MVTGLRRLAALEEAVNLFGDEHQRAVLLLLRVRTRHGVRRRQDVVRVDASLAVEPMPHDARHIEEERLAKEDERYPLIVEDHLAILVLAWYLLIPWEIVGVPHPAVAVGEFLVAAVEVHWCPAVDGRTNV